MGKGVSIGLEREKKGLGNMLFFLWIHPPELIQFRDEHQEQLYNKVREFVGSDKNTLLVSGPPGSGKTFITIHSLLDNFQSKVIVILKTHTQQDHYKKLFGDDFLAIRGIEYHCRIQQVKLHPLKNQLCRWMRLGKHRTCMGCQYRLQFMQISRHKVVSFLYSHSAELIKSILDSLNEKYVLVFDEYHHTLPREQVMPSYYVRLAEAEYGKKIDLNDAGIVDELERMKEIGERNWRRIGYSYFLHLTETIQYLKDNNRWFYRVEGGYAYLDDSIYSLMNKTDAKKIFISATPLPQIEGLLTYDEQYNITPRLENIIFLIYSGFRFTYRDRSNEKIIKHIRKLLYHLSKYRTVIFFPSRASLKSVYQKIPENFTMNPNEFPSKNTLLIAGGKYGEGIDLPQDIEVLCVVGIPFDDPLFKNLYLRELFKYFNTSMETRNVLYNYKALLKVVQSIGRGVRNIKQKTLVILADKRYMSDRWIKYFPLWMKVNISRFRGINDIKLLDEFITRWTLGLNNITWLDKQK